MKKTFITIINLLAIITICHIFTGCNPTSKGSLIGQLTSDEPDTITKEYDINKFDAIEIENLIKVTLKQGDHYSLKIVSSQTILDRIKVINKFGELHIEVDESGLSLIKNPQCRAYLTVPSLRKIELSGAASLEGETGANHFVCDVPVTIECENASSIKGLIMKAAGFDIKTESASSIKDVSLQTIGNIKIESEGASSIDMTINADGKSEITAESASNITLRGKINIGLFKAEGASNISAGQLQCQSKSISSESASSINVDNSK